MPRKRTFFLSGNEAAAEGAYEAGIRVAASYPGTPASEILEHLSRYAEVDSQWSVNEKVAFEVALSAAVAGLRSLYASKHVGLNVAMDPLMTSAYVGVNAGFVIISCDDPGIHSSQNEQDNRLLARMAQIPLLEPSSPAETKEFVKTALGISERFDTPVMVRLTTRIAHTKENVFVEKRKEVPARPFRLDPAKYVMVPANAYRRHIELRKRIERLKRYAENSPLNRMELNDRRIGFITSGITYLYTREAYPGASFLKLGFTFPFPENRVREFARRVKSVFVVEELEPYLEEQVRMLGIKFRAKDPSFRVGELRPEFIRDLVRGKKKIERPAKTRKPVMCPGCPHRPVFQALKKLKAVVTGDIGCYTLGALPPLGSLHTCLCMGSGITFFEGFKKALKKDVVGVIGDSTFVHAGISGLINLAYNRTRGLVIILDNGTTAMTGSQPHPATGVTLRGNPTKKLVLEDVCRACGADHVDVIHPYRLRELEELIGRRINEDALSVIIARAPCRLIDRNRGEPPVYVPEKCRKCYLCLGFGCPAIQKTGDGLIRINTDFCAGCLLCVDVCPPAALVKKTETGG